MIVPDLAQVLQYFDEQLPDRGFKFFAVPVKVRSFGKIRVRADQ